MKTAYIAAFAVLSVLPATARSQTHRLARVPRPGPSIEQIEQPAIPPLGDGDLLPTPESVSEQGAGFGLADIEQMALQNNPTLSLARARVQAARGVWEQVGLYPNPVIGYSAGEIGNEGRGGQQGGYIGQSVVTAGKLRLNRQVAAQEVARLQQEMAAQQFRILTDVRTSYYEALVAQRSVELAERLVKIAKQGVEAAEALLNAKEGSRVDLLQARVETNTTGILLSNARKRHQGAWRRLAAVAGVADLVAAPLSGNIEEVGAPVVWDDALSHVLSASPELSAASAPVRAAQWATQRARVQWIPNVGLQATVQHDNATGDDIAGVQVSIPIPIFNRNQGNIVAADARLAAACRNVDRVRLSLQERLAVVYRQYAAAAQQVEKYRATILPDAKETLELVTAGYQQGEFSYLNLLTAQRTYFQSTLAYLESLFQLKSAQAQIDGMLVNQSLSVSSDLGIVP